MSYIVDPQYTCKIEKPKDFDVFWKGVTDQLIDIPLNPEIYADPLRSSPSVEVFRVFYNSLDNVKISGWYAIPRRRSSAIPGVLLFPGYLSDPPIPKTWAEKGFACLSVAPRGKIGSKQQFDPGYPGLLTHNIIDRNTYTYRGFYVDAWRAVDFLMSRSEIDDNRIGVTGISQGGGLSITTAAMRPEVSVASVGAPYLVGFMDSLLLTDTYPYEEINDYLRLYPERKTQVESSLAYFDGINFADKITCPIMVHIGLQDNVCPPETGFHLFRELRSQQKELFAYDGHGHDANRKEHQKKIEAFFQEHIGSET